MKCPLLLLALLLWLTPPTSRADDLLANGSYYYDAKIVAYYGDKVWIRHRDGSAELFWKDLSGSVQIKYAKDRQAALAGPAPSPAAKPLVSPSPTPTNSTAVEA